MLIGIILTLAFYSFLAAQKRPDKPWKMVMDPDDDEDNEVSSLGQGCMCAILRTIKRSILLSIKRSIYAPPSLRYQYEFVTSVALG